MDIESKCDGCGLILPDFNGPIHAYMTSSPACWKMYGEVLSREYSDPAYWSVHRLTVDAYALQHPGGQDRRAIQSVSVHFASLYLIFEKNYSLDQATEALGPLIKKHKDDFVYLVRPDLIGHLTVEDVIQAKTGEEHIEIVRAWAQSVFAAWYELHALYVQEMTLAIV